MRKTILFLTGAIALGACAPAYAAIKAGDPAPSLVAQELSKENFDLAAMKGKVVLVNFWATWCPPCREEMPLLDKVYQRYHGQGLEIIGVSVDTAHSRDAVEKMAGDVHYPVVALSDVTNNGFGMPSILPMSYVIDTQGMVHELVSPALAPLSEASLTDAVKPLLPK